MATVPCRKFTVSFATPATRRRHWRLRQQNRPRRESRGDRTTALEASAVNWLKEAQSSQELLLSPTTASFFHLQSLLKHLHAADEIELQIWCNLLGSASKLCDLEAQLRQKAIDIFDVVKFEVAKSGATRLRADLLRPSCGGSTCTEIWETIGVGGSGGSGGPRELAKLSGCQEDEATALLHFGQRLSELFAPIEFSKQIARKDWTKVPHDFSAGLLPSFDAIVRSLQADVTAGLTLESNGTSRNAGKSLKVSVFGASGCLVAAAAHRLGCQSSLAEPRELLRRCLELLFLHNDVSCAVGDEADISADVFVLGMDEDGLVEWGHLQLLKLHLLRRRALGLAMPKLLPETLRITAALIDDTLPRLRGCHLNRFERLRGLDLEISHRWPKGACHIQPQFRSNFQVLYNLHLADLLENLETAKVNVSFVPQPGMPITGVAYWLSLPGAPERDAPETAWMCCLQPLPARRVALEGVQTIHVRAQFSEVKLWFEWAEELEVSGCAMVLPPLGKTKLPPWHFKMLNDHERNRRYHMALARALQKEVKKQGPQRVLDCGCGAGLLSLLASREGRHHPMEITAVELSPLISDITQEIFTQDAESKSNAQLNLLTGDVRALGPEQGRYNLIVSELMDASGVGESLLSVLEHACRNLSLPGAQVIPCGIRLIGALGWLTLPSCHDAFDFSALDALHFCSRQGGPFSKDVPPACLHGGVDLPSLHSGPFTSRNLNRLRRNEVWDLLTEEQTLLSVDFGQALLGKSLYPCANEVELLATGDGVANCLIWWWEVQLDEIETLSNRPIALGGYATHWHQPLLPFGPLPVKEGDRFLLKVSISDAVGQKLNFTLESAEPGCASAWQNSMPQLPPDPLMPLLSNWQKELEEACAENTALTSKFTSRGDLRGLAKLQKAVLVLSLMPRAFGCDPFIRDRLLQSYFGVAYK